MIIRRIIFLAFFSCIAAAQDKEAESSLPEGCRVISVEPSKTGEQPSPVKIEQNTPEQAATSYLKLLADEKSIPDSLQIRSPYINHERKKEITQEMQTISDLLSQTLASLKGYRHLPEMSIIKTVEDKDLASVFFLIRNKDFPLKLTGSTLALVKRDGLWKVGPRTGSFENTGLPFTDNSRDRAQKLITNLTSEISDSLNLMKLARQDELDAEITELRNQNKGKSRTDLVKQLIEAIRMKNPVAVCALTDAPNSKYKDGKQRFAAVLGDMGMLNDTNKNMGLSYSMTLLRLAADPANIIVPISEKKEIPEKREGAITVISGINVAEDDAAPKIGITVEGVEKSPESLERLILRNPPASEKKDEKETTVRQLGVIALNMLPMYGWGGGDASAYLAYRIPLTDPDAPENNPFFLRLYSESFDDLQPVLTEQTETLEKIAGEFHKYYPQKQWNSPETAARAILDMASQGDTTGLLQSIDPGFMEKGKTKSFIAAIEFLRNLIMSSQLPYPIPQSDTRNRYSGQKFISQSLYVITNPFSPETQKAMVYLMPGENEAIVLADAPESEKTPGLSKIRFKIVKNKEGKWNLKVYPGSMPLLNSTMPGVYSLSRFRRGDKNGPTLNEDDPFFRACRRHFLDAMQSNAD